MVIAGVAIEVGGDWLATPFHKTVEDARQLELSRLNNDTARLSTEGDIARKETAEAKLQLEQLRKEMAPRSLRRDIFLKELAGQPKLPVEIMYLLDDPECFGLAQQISRALEDAQWTVEPPKPIPPLILADSPTPMSVGGQPSGVTVVVHAITQEESEATSNALMGLEWVRTPWTVLMHALGDSIGKINGHAGGSNVPPMGTLRVVVAPKP